MLPNNLGEDFLSALNTPPDSTKDMSGNNIGEDFLLALRENKDSGYANPETLNLTPEQQMRVDNILEFEKTKLGKSLKYVDVTLGAIPRALGISQPYKNLSDQLRETYQTKNKDGMPGVLREQSREVLNESFGAAKFLVGGAVGGLFKGALALASLSAAQEGLDGVLEGEGIKENLQDVSKVGASTLIGDLAVGGALRGLSPIAKGFEPFAKKGAKVIRAKAIMNELDNQIKGLSKGSKQAVINLDNKIQKLRGEKLKIKIPEKIINNIDTSELGFKIESLNRSIDEFTASMIEPMSNSLKQVKKNLGDEYEKILGTEVGNTPLNIQDELELLISALDIKSTDRLNENIGKLAQKLLIGTSDSKLQPTLKKLSTPLLDQTQEGLILKDVHWLKQALNDYSSNLLNNPSNHELYFAIKNITKQLDGKIDKVVGGSYKALNKKYREFIQVDDFVNKKIGPVVSLFGEEKRLGVQKIGDEIKKEIKKGRAIDSKFLQDTNAVFRALSAKVKLLKENGLNTQAQQIEDAVSKIAEANIQKIMLSNNLEKTKNILNLPSQDYILAKQTQQEIQDKINKLTLLKQRNKTITAQKILNRQNRSENVVELFEDKSVRDYLGYIEKDAVGSALANSVPSIKAKAAINIARFVNALKIYGLEKSTNIQSILRNADDAVKNSRIPKHIQLSVNNFIQSISDDEE